MFQINCNQQLSDPINLFTNVVVLIGRSDACDVRLKDPSASRVHCRLIAHDGRVSLYDAGSRWGTFVNGQRVTECDLRPGDRIKVGETTLQLTTVSNANDVTLARRSELVRPPEMTVYKDQNPLWPRVNDQQQIMEGDLSLQGRLLPTKIPRIPERPLRADEIVGTSFHCYNVIRLLTETSSAMVFEARSRGDDFTVALKIFKPATFTTEIAEQRFVRAMKTMLGRRHPNIVELLDAGKSNGYFYTASEFVEGVSALELIKKIGIVGMLPTDRVLRIASDLCESLAFAESIEIVHRNIRPANILIRESDGIALLNDLVLARSIEITDSERFTNTGDILGDVSYMSPEQLGSGYPLDQRSDIYQLGVTLCAMLTGKPPHEGGSVAATIVQILSATPSSLRAKNLSIPLALDSVIVKMLAKNPADRYQSASELARALGLVAREICRC